MRVRHIVTGVAICAAATGVATDVHAWDDGSGRICTADGQIITKPTEQAWQHYLDHNGGSKPYHDGVVCVPPTTTTGATTSLPPTSSTTTPTNTVASSTSTTAPPVDDSPPISLTATTVRTPSSPSVPPSTPSSEQPGEMCNTSSQNSDGATSTGCEKPSPSATPGSTSPGAASSSPSTLPSTGPSETKQTAMAAVGLVAMGAALFSIARRKDRTS